MNRRSFIKLLLAVPFVGTITMKAVEWLESLFPVEEEFTLANLESLRHKLTAVPLTPNCHVLIMHPSDIERLKHDPDWYDVPSDCIMAGKSGFYRGFAIYERGGMT